MTDEAKILKQILMMLTRLVNKLDPATKEPIKSAAYVTAYRKSVDK